jgi:hypothetical protein
MKITKKTRKSCKHFRYLIPNEDANELRKTDKEPCEVCDNLIFYFRGEEEQQTRFPVTEQIAGAAPVTPATY